jgi:hypothetical protein
MKRNVAFKLSEKPICLAAEVLDNVHIHKSFIAVASIVKHKKDASLAINARLMVTLVFCSL